MTKKIFYGWWIVFSCSIIGVIVGGVVFFGFTAFFEPIRNEFGWSYAQISLAASLQGLEMGIFAPVSGFIVDRYGARLLIFWGIIIIGLGLLLLSFTQSLIMFYSIFLLISFGAGGCAAVVMNTAVANWFYRKIGIALGLMGSGIGAGGFVVFLIVKLIDLFQWRKTLVILGLGIWALGVPLSLIIRDRPEDYGLLPDGEISDIPMSSVPLDHAQSEMNLKQIIRERTFLLLNLAEITRMMSASAVILHVMPYLSSLGIQRTTGGLVAGAIPIIGIAGRLAFGWLCDIFDKKNMIVLSYIFLSAGMLSFSYAQEIIMIILFLAFFPIGHGGSMVIRGTILREFFGRNSFGRMIGITMGAGAFGGVIGPTLAGFVFDITGSYYLIWLIFSGLIGFSVILLLNIKRYRADS